jgi:hypothetical protein
MAREIGTRNELAIKPRKQSVNNNQEVQIATDDDTRAINRTGAGAELIFQEARDALLQPGAHRPMQFKGRVTGVTEAEEDPINVSVGRDGKPLKTIVGDVHDVFNIKKAGDAALVQNNTVTKFKDQKGTVLGAIVETQQFLLASQINQFTSSIDKLMPANGDYKLVDRTNLDCQFSGTPERLKAVCTGTIFSPSGKPLYKVQDETIYVPHDWSSSVNYFNLKGQKVGSISGTVVMRGDTTDVNYHVLPVAQTKRHGHK